MASAALIKASLRRVLLARRLIGSLLVVSFAIPAFSAPATTAPLRPQRVVALKSPTTKQEAIDVVTTAENRPIESYFTHGGTPQDLARLDADMKVLAEANAKIGMADEVSKFNDWYALSKTVLIMNRQRFPAKNLQGYFTVSYVKYKHDTASNSQLANWIGHVTSNPTISQVSLTSYIIVSGISIFAYNTIRGALIAGPAAGIVGAYVDPIARVLKENAAVIGTRHLGKLGVRLTNWFAERSRRQAVAELAKMGDAIAEAESSFAQTRDLVERMGYEMSAEQYTSNINRIQEIWGEVNRVWGSVNTGIFKDGRSLTTDALMNRPLMFVDVLMGSISGAEVFHQGIEDGIDRIITRSGRPATEIEPLVDELMTAIDQREQSDVKDIVAAELKISEARVKLKAVGAPDRQVQRIVEQRRNELIFAKQTVATLAANMLHDWQYEEFNRSLPMVIRESQRVLRSNYCIDFYHHEMSIAVAKVLQTVQFQINSTKELINEAQGVAKLESTVFADSKEAEAAKNKVRKAKTRMTKIREHSEALVGNIRRGIMGETCSDIFSPGH